VEIRKDCGLRPAWTKGLQGTISSNKRLDVKVSSSCSSYMGSEDRSFMVQYYLDINMRPYLKSNYSKKSNYA
jgi:hypothetical protein